MLNTKLPLTLRAASLSVTISCKFAASISMLKYIITTMAKLYADSADNITVPTPHRHESFNYRLLLLSRKLLNSVTNLRNGTVLYIRQIARKYYKILQNTYFCIVANTSDDRTVTSFTTWSRDWLGWCDVSDRSKKIFEHSCGPKCCIKDRSIKSGLIQGATRVGWGKKTTLRNFLHFSNWI